MSNIEIQITNFQGDFSNLNCDSKTLNINFLDFFRSFVTFGFNPNNDLPGQFSNIIFRFFLSPGIIFLLDFKHNLKMNKFFFDFDASEKSNISYYLGMTFTKYVYEKQLNIPWLLNVDYLIKTGHISLDNGNSKKGDLIGKDINDNWHVVEAKGRSNNPETGLMSRAKNQAKKISHINNISVSTNSGSITNLKHDPIRILVEDPIRDKNNIRINFHKNSSFFKAYYSKFFEIMNIFGYNTLEFQSNKYDYFTINTINDKKIIFGILSSIRNNPDNAITIISNIKSKNEKINETSNVSIGKDGTIVMLKSMKEIEKYT